MVKIEVTEALIDHYCIGTRRPTENDLEKIFKQVLKSELSHNR